MNHRTSGIFNRLFDNGKLIESTMVGQRDAWYDEKIKEFEESKTITIELKKKKSTMRKRRGTLLSPGSLPVPGLTKSSSVNVYKK